MHYAYQWHAAPSIAQLTFAAQVIPQYQVHNRTHLRRALRAYRMAITDAFTYKARGNLASYHAACCTAASLRAQVTMLLIWRARQHHA